MMTKKKRFIALLLSFMVLFSSFTVTAYADNVSFYRYEYHIIDLDTNTETFNQYNSIPFSANIPWSISNNNRTYFVFVSNVNHTIEKGDSFSIDFTISGNVSPCNAYVALTTGDGVQSTNNYLGSCRVDTGGIGKISFTVDSDTTFKSVILRLTNISNYNNISIGISNLRVSTGENTSNKISSKLTNLSNNLFNWINSVITSITNGFHELKTNLLSFFSDLDGWITDAVQSVVDLFDDLFDNLGNWFRSVGQWFTDIGDRISGFFSNLWTNISNAITDRVTAFHEWWNSLWTLPDGWSEEYKNRWETWLNAHFGLLIQGKELNEELFGFFSFISSVNKLVITIPKITIPVVDVVLVKKTTFNFSTLVGDENSKFFVIYDYYKYFVSAISSYFVLMFARKTLLEIIEDRKGEDL